MNFKPKVSPSTGKWIEVTGIVDFVGHLAFNSMYYITCEKKQFDIFAVRDQYGIVGWITDLKDKKILSHLDGINVYLRPICSPFIVRKEGKTTEFEYHQKGSMCIQIQNERECMLAKQILEGEKRSYSVYNY